MKKLILILLVSRISSALCALSGTQIINRADDLFRSRTSLAVSKMTIITSSGDPRTFLQWGMTMGDRTVTKFASGFVRGMTILTVDNGDQIWVYFRSSGRTRRLASHARNSSVAGSDFSYDDFSNTAYARKYRCTLMGEDDRYWTVTLLPRGESHYSSLTARVRKSDFVPVSMVYYNKHGVRYKELKIEEVRTIGGVLTPMVISMKNLLTGSRTVIRTEKIVYPARLRPEFFSSSGLSRSMESWKAVYPFFR